MALYVNVERKKRRRGVFFIVAAGWCRLLFVERVDPLGPTPAPRGVGPAEGAGQEEDRGKCHSEEMNGINYILCHLKTILSSDKRGNLKTC